MQAGVRRRAILVLLLVVALVAIPIAAYAALTVERAELDGTRLRVEGIGAVPDATISVGGVAMGQAGASGYLLKSAPVSELVKAIREVHQGKTPLDPSIARKLVAHMETGQAGAKGSADDEHRAKEQLTGRELEVLHLLARGLSNRAIAHQLSISDRTVQAHLTNVFAKMGVGSRVEAVLEAIRREWLTLDS